LAQTSPTGGGRSVGIVRVRTKATEFSFLWAMWMRVTEWLTVTPSAAAHSSGRKNCPFNC